MLGAIIGDIIGSRFEFKNSVPGDGFKNKDFILFNDHSRATDDSIMTMAIAKAFWESRHNLATIKDNAIKAMQEFGRKIEYAGYGKLFRSWIWNKNPKPYNSFGNGSAMRVSPIGFVANNIEECKKIIS